MHLTLMQVWVASDKREYAARTIRPKIHKQLPTFLEEFPPLPALPAWSAAAAPIDWARLLQEATERGALHRVLDLTAPVHGHTLS